MTVLTAKARSKMPGSTFALPGRRFPINDKVHARVAKSYASRMVKRGQLSSSQKSTIDAKANRMLGKAAGGRMRLADAARGPMKRQAGKPLGLRRYASGGPVDASVNPFDNSARTRAALPDYE